ncbi:MAG: histidine kinase N-terminal 7TM domain-containing protein [Thermoplasmata archaeon]
MFTGYVVPPVVSIIIFVALMVSFIRIRKNVHYSAFLYAFLFFLWSVGELLERIASPPGEQELALLGLKIIAIAGAFLPAALIQFATVFPVKLKAVPNWVIFSLYIISSAIALVSASTDFLVEGLIVYGPGWGAYYGKGMILWGTYIICGTVIAIWMLEKSSFEGATTPGRTQARIIGIALAISLCCAAITGYLPPLMGIQDFYPLTTIPFGITGILLLHTFLKYHQMLNGSKGPCGKSKIEPGYFWCENKKRARAYFQKVCESEMCLLITDNPDVPEKLQKQSSVIVVAKNGDLNPMDEEAVGKIPFLVEKFVGGFEGKVVLVEAFDELFAHYYYSTISLSAMLGEIKECAKKYNARIICAFEPGVLEGWQISEIKKDGRELKEE